MKDRFHTLSLIVFLAFPVLAAAQPAQTTYASAGQVSPQDRMALSSRAAAMGSAFTGVADDASALLFNPAGLGGLRRGEAGLHSDLGWTGLFRETAVVGLPLGPAGGAGFSFSYLDHGTFEGRDNVGSLAAGYGANRMAFQAGWGLLLIPEASLGLDLRYVRQTLADNTTSVLAPEVGILVRPIKGVQAGFDYLHAGWGDMNGTLLSTWRFGVSWREKLDPSLGFLLAGDNSLDVNSNHHFQAGLEMSYLSRFFVRTGYQGYIQGRGYDGFSFGAGFDLAGLILDYAFLPNGELGDNHRFSLTYPFESLFVPGKMTAPQKSVTDRTGTAALGGKGTLGTGKGAAGLASKDGTVNEDPHLSSGSEGSPLPVKNAAGSEAKASSGNTGTAVSGGAVSGGNPALSVPPLEKVPETTPKPEDAKERLSLQFEIPPDFVAQGSAFEAKGQWAEAIHSYDKAVEQDARNVQAWWSLGRLHVKLGQRDKAVQCMEKALSIRPDNAALRKWLDKYKTQP